jgi:hypothetical protein
MTKTDRAALTLALERCRAQGESRSRQLDEMLEGESWQEVATFAAFSCQMRSLRLKPWQFPPCFIYFDEPVEADDIHGKHEAQQLLREMFEHDISRWHPFPLEAIEEAKAKAKAAT